ncbi:hypothetical protein G6F50_016996 [Rhizopus delemar]|uniref:Uncharacterized protein n=1 Tax=Rhizopus delemar TaxID=936053 RepID=A0A9P7C0D3_9FUNG|nr:hypothetical protein G6F50_016996 [Rhizopus delemar]
MTPPERGASRRPAAIGMPSNTRPPCNKPAAPGAARRGQKPGSRPRNWPVAMAWKSWATSRIPTLRCTTATTPMARAAAPNRGVKARMAAINHPKTRRRSVRRRPCPDRW